MAGSAVVAPQYGTDRIVVGDKPMLACAFFVDTAATATATFRNGDTLVVGGTLTDPTTMTLAVTKPDGTATTYTYAGTTVTKYATGVFDKLDVTVDQPGIWLYTWTGTGTVPDVQDGSFDVFAAGDTTQYCTVEELHLRFGIGDTTDDVQLSRAVKAACRRIDSYCGRERFWRDAAVVNRVFEASSPYCVNVPVGISTATGLIVKTDLDGDGTFETIQTITTDFLLKPYNSLVRSPAWPADRIEIVGTSGAYFPSLYGRPGVQITARFGWPAVPDDVAEAALILSHRLFKRKETASGVVGVDGMGATVRLSRTDPDVAELLAPYAVLGVG